MDFGARHIGPDHADRSVMLTSLGYSDLETFIKAVVPAGIADTGPMGVPSAVGESQALDELQSRMSAMELPTSMIGLGYHGTVIPEAIKRGILLNTGWYTAYTPYQPEISQGRLEALLNFQTLVEDLTGLAVAGASLLDEATAVAEAVAIAVKHGPRGVRRVAIDVGLHPQVRAVVHTRAEPVEIEIVEFDPDQGLVDGELSGVVLAYPASTGRIVDPRAVLSSAKARGALVVMDADPLALTLLRSPGALGADIAVGSMQRYGVPMAFGGPHAGYIAVRSGLERSLPGRLVGVSVDADGRPAYRLALQTREQHIRREKATSNICTAQVLLAVLASMYAVYHGPDGLRGIARRVNHLAERIRAGARDGGLSAHEGLIFDTVALQVPGAAQKFADQARTAGINVRVVDADTVSVTVDETTTKDQAQALAAEWGFDLADVTDGDRLGELGREEELLPYPVFHRHRSETALMRYMRSLADKDLALDRTMIPLGSCTMKLNAAAEMAPITWPEFANAHPFAPAEQVRPYVEMITELEGWLAGITGYDAVSVQPNAGSQGEFAGLMAIRAYHQANGDAQRTVCLIPSSAHGTNAASAVMAGMHVVVVACDESGDVDLTDLESKINEHRENLAALMITYPSTHGVFEEAVGEICSRVHEAGGQVYIDGANLNALVGLAKPGAFGADVSHLNLHKTFAIPHGGGGPGVGPIGVRAHLAPFLPGHPLRPDAGPSGRGYADGGMGPVSGAPWGSAGILPIPWMYIRMMGEEGLREATSVAILSANYIAHRLEEHYPILYTAPNGTVAHECIVDIRPVTAESGVSVDDIAKRLMDYGFHAPTMSFPVAGTLMIEPTESENAEEIDRFCDAMIAIKSEIDAIRAGEWPSDDNPLVHAPHTADCLIGEWQHAYPARIAAFPVSGMDAGKYWPPVRRIDGAYGDRNLVCACPRPEELTQA
ncbi:MAG: aminomethyl-transferring glycine dehydrogenase [Candidatus Nanopelagicales bacterium]|nr:aminomethyl-transferring glycine dehydrogenase [Candidatus Nanopelagicales bacterium]MBL6834448.1 aminomethyl-transferring glycine dehydrogenase [Candidatus Nanopelagicales bacterium]